MLMNESKCMYTYTRVFVNYSNQNRTFTRQSWCEGGRRKERDEQMPVQPERQTRGMKKREKGCWQTVTGTTLSATRFCAYHSPPIHHRRHRCHPRPIWSDLNLLDPILYSRAPYICRLLLRSSSSLLFPVTQHESLFTQRSCCLFLPRRQTCSRSSEREAQLRFGNRTAIRPHCRPIVLKKYTTPMEVSCKFGRWEKYFTTNEIKRYNTRCTFALLQFIEE